MKDLAIIVPIYKKTLLESEKISLQSLVDKLPYNDYDLCIIHPGSWVFSSVESTDYVNSIYKNALFYEYPDRYFESTDSYSELLKEQFFYEDFKNYKYILIFQTDCLLFDISILDKWINEGFDYVGCPIIANKQHWPSIPVAGNGGLSLRKVETFIDILKDKDLINKLNENEVYRKYEDVFFIEGVRQYYHLDLPTWQDAACSFAWDMNPDILYNTFEELPTLGCHAFVKNLPFWSCHIPELGKLKEECLEYHREFVHSYYNF